MPEKAPDRNGNVFKRKCLHKNKGDTMEYSELVGVYGRLEATSKRLEKTHVIAQWLPEVKEKELSHVILLLQ